MTTVTSEKRQIRVALAGNPNVGKSTVFNALTGLHQHTGNWSGKTVTTAKGEFSSENARFEMIDLPGTYSLYAHSDEERAARDYICFENPDRIVIVADAGALERNLSLALSICECRSGALLVLNLWDEAKKNGISVDEKELSRLLGIPVIPAVARDKRGISEIVSALDETDPGKPYTVPYPCAEEAISIVEDALREIGKSEGFCLRWLAVKLLENESVMVGRIAEACDFEVWETLEIDRAITRAIAVLDAKGINFEHFSDYIASCIVAHAEKIAARTVTKEEGRERKLTKGLDRILIGKYTAAPTLLLMLGGLLWLSAVGANYPSQWLSVLFARIGEGLTWLMRDLPWWIRSPLLDGVYLVVTWVVSVMLPPMAIFFPLFTLAEDFGILPRVAFDLDAAFRRAGTCGKQSLTMCMGIGCNCTGIIGARIIDSGREKLIAILTNVFVPCNGRLPLLIALATMFFAIGGTFGIFAALLSFLIVAVIMTLAVSFLLSKTVLKGEKSSFALELPPYRRPKIGEVLVRSILDRTVFVLLRSLEAAAPAGLLIWLLANISVGGSTILCIITEFLNPIGVFLGMDGVILVAFLLGLPANEIVLPIILMCYLGNGTLTDYGSLEGLRALLTENGWTVCTALCTSVFCLFHFPCATAIQTVGKETGSIRYTVLAVLLPTAVGVMMCALIAGLFRIFG